MSGLEEWLFVRIVGFCTIIIYMEVLGALELVWNSEGVRCCSHEVASLSQVISGKKEKKHVTMIILELA